MAPLESASLFPGYNVVSTVTNADLLGSRQPLFSGTFSRVLAPLARSADKVFADDGRRWDACPGPAPPALGPQSSAPPGVCRAPPWRGGGADSRPQGPSRGVRGAGARVRARPRRAARGREQRRCAQSARSRTETRFLSAPGAHGEAGAQRVSVGWVSKQRGDSRVSGGGVHALTRVCA